MPGKSVCFSNVFVTYLLSIPLQQPIVVIIIIVIDIRSGVELYYTKSGFAVIDCLFL